MSEQTVSTPYGVLDRAALLKAQQSFDTRALLQMVEALDRFLVGAREQDGLRDQLLQLHRMSHRSSMARASQGPATRRCQNWPPTPSWSCTRCSPCCAAGARRLKNCRRWPRGTRRLGYRDFGVVATTGRSTDQASLPKLISAVRLPRWPSKWRRWAQSPEVSTRSTWSNSQLRSLNVEPDLIVERGQHLSPQHRS